MSAVAPREPAVEAPAPPEGPRGSSSPMFFRPARRPSGSRQGGPVFGVGRQAFVDGQGLPKRQVGIVDEKGLVSLGSLADGTEVEIVGWVPKGPATRYLVRSTKDGVEGWLGASNLRATRKPLAPGVEPKASIPPVSIPPRMPRGEVARRAPVPTSATPARKKPGATAKLAERPKPKASRKKPAAVAKPAAPRTKSAGVSKPAAPSRPKTKKK